MGSLFIFLIITPETQKNTIRIHRIRMIQTALLNCKAGIFSKKLHLNVGDTIWPEDL